MGEAACVIAAYQSKPSRWKVTRLTRLEKENCSKEQVMINSGRGLLPKPLQEKLTEFFDRIF